jgi:hypothetical protein
MRYLRAVVVGIAAAFLAAVMWLFAALIIPVFLTMVISGVSASGSGGIGAVSVGVGDSTFVAAMVGFLVGFVWSIRKTSRPRELPPPTTNG